MTQPPPPSATPPGAPGADAPDSAVALRASWHRRRAWARAVLLIERTWPRLWPVLGVLGVFVCLALLDIPRALPPVLHILLLLAFAAALAAVTWRGLRGLRLPSADEGDRRLERASGLRHRPLAVLTDRPALPGSDALWHAHLARAAAQVKRLHPGWPRPGMAARDPRALRAALIVALAASVGVAGPDVSARLGRAFVPAFGAPPATVPTQIDAWITAPAYTGVAPVFLSAPGGAVAVPAGSHLTLSLSGGGIVPPALTLGGGALDFAALDAESWQADHDLTEGGRLALRRAGRDLAAWDLTVVADAPPAVSWTEPPGRARGTARVPQTRLPWQATDDYGVVSLQAELRLRDRPEAPPVLVTIPLPGGSPRNVHGTRAQDFTAHPWAGLQVVARLVGRDAAGLTGTSDDAGFLLPERRFENPTARAVLAVRRQLSLTPNDRARAAAALDVIGAQDEPWSQDLGAFTLLRDAISALRVPRAAPAVEEVQSRLWELALHLEEGATQRTARTLAEARAALRDALDAEKRGEKVDPAEIDRRMEAVEKALREHMAALADQLRRDPDAAQVDPQTQQLDAQDAQRLAEEMREAAREGRMDAARDKMAELERMLDQLQAARPMHRSQQQKERAQKQQRGQQQMSAVQDIIQREGTLADHAQRRQQETAPPRGGNRISPPPSQSLSRPQSQSPDQSPPAGQPGSAEQRQRDARAQQAMRRALGELMQQFGDLTGKVPPNLGDADLAMRDAARALEQGQDADVGPAAEKAIAALQEGAQQMSQTLAEQFGESGDQGEEGQASQDGGQDGPQAGLGNGQDGTQRRDGGGGNRPWRSGQMGQRGGGDRGTDPLGRPLQEGASGTDESDDVALPQEMERARTREIQQELRRRGADRGRPQPELDYIDRLLREF